MKTTIYVLHGPNLNLLGTREPAIYGDVTLLEIDQKLKALGTELDIRVDTYQSNHEGDLIEQLQQAATTAAGVIINPGGYTHTSVAIRDAVTATRLPTIEVHLSNIHAREEFRRISMIAPVCIGTIAGFGAESYYLALRALISYLTKTQDG
jgi:3-dehydroquinate dehydratase II